MRYLATLAIALGVQLFWPENARAEGAACAGLEMGSAQAVLACVQAEPENPARMRSTFRPNETCWAGQHYVRDLAIVADNPSLKGRLSKRVRQEAAVPSCRVIAEIVQTLHGQPPAWLDCDGYDGSAAHLERCLAASLQRRGRSDRRAVARQLARMDCTRMIRAYEAGLGRVYDFHFDESGAGRRLPPGYAAPECADLETLRASLTEEARQADVAAEADVAARRQESRAESREAARAQREADQQAIAQKLERQRAQRERAMRAALDNEIDQQILEKRRETTQPADKVDEKALRYALIARLHRIYDRSGEALRDGFGGDAQMVHTASGVRAARRSGAALITLDRTILSVKNAECALTGDDWATCEFDLTIGEQIQSDQATLMTRVLTGGLDMPLDFANRSARFKVRLQHGGLRWIVYLTTPQKLFLEGVGTTPGRFWAPFIQEKWPKNASAPHAGDGLTRSAFLGRSNAPNTLMMHVALGCSHCLTSLDGSLDALKEHVASGRLRIDLNEVSGLLARRGRDDADDEQAVRNSATVGWLYDCAIRHKPGQALDLIETFISVLKENVAGGDQVRSWEDWVYATPADLAEGRRIEGQKAGATLIATFRDRIEHGPEQCMTDNAAAAARIEARRARFTEEGHPKAPSYFFNGRQMTLEEVLARLERSR